MPRFIETDWGLAIDMGSIEHDDEGHPIYPEGWEPKPCTMEEFQQAFTEVMRILNADPTD